MSHHGTPHESHIADSILDVIGHTPLVRINKMNDSSGATLLAKLEYLNPGGSVKDRPAINMIVEAEAAGLLKPGGTIIEPTSGNTGVGLALAAAVKGYKCIFVVIDKVAKEKIDMLRAYGAEVVVCPTAVPPDHPDSYYSVSDRLLNETPDSFKPNQFENPANPESHTSSTGPEIWKQTGGKITHLVASIGTGGTICGIARYLKSQNPNIEVIGADPAGSVYSGGNGRPYLVEGVGEDFFPNNYDQSLIDRVVPVKDSDAFHTSRRLTREEGLFVGGSAGMAMHAALQLAQEAAPEAMIVTVLPDSGRGYTSKFYNDDWMADHGFLHTTGPLTASVLELKAESLPEIITVEPDQPVYEAIAAMSRYGVSQLIVSNAKPPLALSQVLGTVTESNLLRQLHSDNAILNQQVRHHMSGAAHVIGIGESIATAVHRLQSADVLMVVDKGEAVGVITNTDVLEYLSRQSTEQTVTSNRAASRTLSRTTDHLCINETKKDEQ